MNKDIKKECVLDSIRCWALSNGYQEITDNEDDSYSCYYLDIAFQKDNRATGFILVPYKHKKKLKCCIAYARSLCDYIFAIICDADQQFEFEDLIPSNMGIIYYTGNYYDDNSYRIVREPLLI